MKYHIAPSILNCNLTKLDSILSTFDKVGVDTVHLDIMDGQFVPKISFGSLLVRGIDDHFTKDVHLMVKDPIKQVKLMADAGANIITFHYEAYEDDSNVKKIIALIKSFGCNVGIAINPTTPVKFIEKYLSDIDLVLVMSVKPGEGGQEFNYHTLTKLEELKTIRFNNGLNYLLEIDGGINPANIHLCKEAGADILVVGSYLFTGDDTLENKFKNL